MEALFDKENLTLALMVFLAAWQVGKSILRTIAPTTADDTALGFMEATEKKLAAIEESAWVKENGPTFWAQVEAMSKTQIPALKGAGKLAYYLGMIHDAYVAASGKGLTAAGTATAKNLAAGLAAQEKLGAVGNPPAAPGSK